MVDNRTKMDTTNTAKAFLMEKQGVDVMLIELVGVMLIEMRRKRIKDEQKRSQNENYAKDCSGTSSWNVKSQSKQSNSTLTNAFG